MPPMHETVPSRALGDMYSVLHGHCCSLRVGHVCAGAVAVDALGDGAAGAGHIYSGLHGQCCNLNWGMCAQVLSQWMPMEEEPQGRGAWGRRRTPQAAASVLLLIDSHPLVLNHMVRTPQKL